VCGVGFCGYDGGGYVCFAIALVTRNLISYLVYYLFACAVTIMQKELKKLVSISLPHLPYMSD